MIPIMLITVLKIVQNEYTKLSGLLSFCLKLQNLGLVGHCKVIITQTSATTRKSAKSNACSSYCFNGASCIGANGNISCLCANGFTGLNFFHFIYTNNILHDNSGFSVTLLQHKF